MADSELSVLHLLDHSLPVQDGYSFRASAIIREQRARGWRTWQLTSDKQEDVSGQAEDGLPYLRTRPSDAWFAHQPVINQLATVSSLTASTAEIVKLQEPAVLHAHSPCLVGLAGLRVSRKTGIPIVYEMRASWEDAAVSQGQTTAGSLRYRLSRALETYVLREADAVVTICEGLRQDIVSRGVEAGKVTVVPNGVDAARFQLPNDAGSVIRARYVAHGQRLIGFIGTFFSWEGLELLILAADRLRRQRVDFRILLIGDGPENGALRAMVAKLGLGDLIEFGGRVSAAEVPEYYAAMDLLVYPRLAIDLTEKVTPLKPIEAMAAGRVVLASDVAGHREIIVANETGLIFPAGSPEALCAALSEALDSDDLGRLRVNARRYAREERSWPACVAHYESVYGRILAAGGARH